MSGTITLGTTDGTTYREPASTATEKAVPLDLLLADGARWAVWGFRSRRARYLRRWKIQP